jgi:adenylylsulfate kinase
MTILLTGLPCSGKTTIAIALANLLRSSNHRAEILDGDVIRHELWRELGFSKEDRDENVRRLGHLARLLSRNGAIAIIAAVTPYRASRDAIRGISDNGFMEVHVDAPLAICETRDVKGMYAQARAGKRPHFTGIDDPYEPPLNPEVHCLTGDSTVAEAVALIVVQLRKQGAI